MTKKPNSASRPEHEGVARQHGGIAADHLAAARAQNAGQRVRIEKQRQRRAQRQGGIGAVGAGGIRAREPPAAASAPARPRRSCRIRPAAIGNDDDGGKRGDVDQNVLDDGDRGRRAQSARIGERGQHHEGDEQRQIGRQSGAGNAERADDHLQADQLQGDVGHGRDDAGDAHRERQPAIAETALARNRPR